MVFNFHRSGGREPEAGEVAVTVLAAVCGGVQLPGGRGAWRIGEPAAAAPCQRTAPWLLYWWQ